MNKKKSVLAAVLALVGGFFAYVSWSDNPRLKSLLERSSDRQEGSVVARELAAVFNSRWPEISATRLPYLQFIGGRIASGTAALSEASGPEKLNIAFLDYQCTFCRADHERLLSLVKAHPEQRFFICATPVLGVESIEAARRALVASDHGAFADAHDALMTGRVIAGEVAAPTAGMSWLRAQQNLHSLLGIRATPVYILDGVIVFGTIRQLAADRKPQVL